MRQILAPKPLLVAAVAGAAALYLLRRSGWGDLAKGAALGAIVQVTVRAVGVS